MATSLDLGNKARIDQYLRTKGVNVVKARANGFKARFLVSGLYEEQYENAPVPAINCWNLRIPGASMDSIIRLPM